MREVRRKRVVHEELVSEEKRLRFGAAPGEEERLPVIQALLAESTAWFEERGIAPDVPDEASVARALDLLALYDIVYRIASKTTHHSVFSMLTGFEGEPAEGMLFPKHLLAPNEARPLDLRCDRRTAHRSSWMRIRLPAGSRTAQSRTPYGCSVGSWTTSASLACSRSKVPSRSAVARLMLA